MEAVAERTGAGVLIESFAELGADTFFGLPGVHTLANIDALRGSDLRFVGSRSELNAAFTADGYARASGRPAPLLLSTGPGSLMSLAGLMESASSYVPVLAVVSQIDSQLIDRRRGALHELEGQIRSFAPVVKWAQRADSVEAIPDLVAEAWREALTPPQGPVYLEVPVDFLESPAKPTTSSRDSDSADGPIPSEDALDQAVRWLDDAARPIILAGNGVLRSGAWNELCQIGERLDAPVLVTYMGKGSIPEDHPLYGGSACEEPTWQNAIAEADVVLCVGSELGSETTGQYRLKPPSPLIQVDASEAHVGATYPSHPLIGDAKDVLRALLSRLDTTWRGTGYVRAKAIREGLAESLEAGQRLEFELLQAIRAALPDTAAHAWDMTILGYWAGSAFPVRTPRTWLYPLGSGTIGYAFPAAIGASLGSGVPALAVSGDGGAMYSLQELATARQHEIDVTLLIVDDGGYGILREYQKARYGATHAVELTRPDFVAVAEAYEIPAHTTSAETLTADLTRALNQRGPAVLVLPALLSSPPTFE